jgi:ATP-dependent Clp protease ATP-binding subunit ClpC
MFDRFTSRARAIVVLAQVEARTLNHRHIGTEHLLLGLIKEGEGIAARALQDLGISMETVRAEVVEKIGGQGEGRSPAGQIPFTPRAKKVLELSLREALHLGHDYIGTEHILLGLIREGDGIAARVLLALGADHDNTRAKVIHLLVRRDSDPEPGTGRQAAGARPEPARQRARGIRMPPAGAATGLAAAGGASLLAALEAISERLAAIEARLGISHRDTGGGAGATGASDAG